MSELDQEAANRWQVHKIAIAVMVIGVFLGGWILTGGDVGQVIEGLSQQEAFLLDYQAEHPWIVLAVAFGLYTIVTGVSLPGAAPMTLCYGWFFARAYGETTGLLVCLVLISFASTLGATLAFLISRFLFRDALERKFGDHLAKFNTALEREGAFYLFSLRLIPVVPFWLINLVMGLTPLRVGTYWWVSQLGMLPGTFVYVLAGTKLTDLGKVFEGEAPWGLLWAFALLGVFPLIIKKVMSRFRSPA